jgi:trimeric autotransporter adhesin
MQKLLATAALALGMLLAQGCGHNSAPTAPSSTGSSKLSIRAIQITGGLDGAALTVGDTRQLTASAEFADGSNEDITSLVEWSSADPSVATVTSSGLVTAVGPGTGRIRASYRGTTGESTFNIVKSPAQDDPTGNRDDSGGSSSGGSSGGASPDGGTNGGSGGSGGGGTGGTGGGGGSTALPPTVQSITITGDHNVPVGRNAQFHVIAHMSDGSERDVTGSSVWSSDNAMIGTISQTGWFTGLTPGSNIVRANYDGNSASQPVTVTPL